VNAASTPIVAASARMRLYAVIALGSTLGGGARWLASIGMHDLLGSGFPWGTLFVNVTGSIAIGVYAAAALRHGRRIGGPHQREFVVTGFCGGYTTFSIFSLETISALDQGQFALAGSYVAISVASWLIGVWGGFMLGARLAGRRPRATMQAQDQDRRHTR
jgi:fluoride exporter